MKDGFKNDLRGEFRGDFSRSTFQREKRYSSVRLQQGRVQLDADWNEQVDIQAYRDHLTARDVIGVCGAPLHDAGFALSVSSDGKRLEIGAGRYYVDGILCENDDEKGVDLTAQPDLPGESLPKNAGKYRAYLDAWQRHVTAVEDPSIREVALAGPDTATRTKTVWQVKLQGVAGAADCAQFDGNWTPDDTQSTGRLRARAQPGGTTDDPCVVPPGAGYGRLENQLYRVEIHDGGEPYGAPRSPGSITGVQSVALPKQVKVANDDRVWRADQWVELFHSNSSAPGTLRRITKVDNNTLTLDKDIPGDTPQPNRLRRVATFKFSRDNGAVLARLDKIAGDFVTVSDPGKDPTLAFAGNQWVELGNERRTLRGEPGVLLQLKFVNGNDLEVSWPNNKPLTMGDFPTRPGIGTPPTVRRWDCKEGPIPVTVATSTTAENWQALEDGVEVEFDADKTHTTYRTGDYWLIPARTLTGNVEWPQSESDAQNETKPLFKPRHGVEHHYCPLALLELTGTSSWKLISDCRKLFPPSTELSPLYYVSGDGQEAMPDPTRPPQPPQFVALAAPLQAGVANRAGAKVRFTITKGNGRLQGTAQGAGAHVDVPTSADGIASCNWELDYSIQSQQVEAHLLDEADNPLPLPVRFNANLSVASQVAYDPGSCGGLSGANTVQKALERLSTLSSLYYVSGDGQEVMPQDINNLQPLTVLVANDCGPVARAEVKFEVTEGGGQLDCASDPAVADEDGIASCKWILDDTTPTQQAKATLLSAPGSTAHPNPIHEPLTVHFVANLSVAEQVEYAPPDDCPSLAGTSTVKEALDTLCNREGGGCCSVTVGKGGRYETLQDALKDLRDQSDVCICMLPGEHRPPEDLIIGDYRSVEISGCALGVRIILARPLRVESVAYFALRGVEIKVEELMEQPLVFSRCDEVRLGSCRITGLVPDDGTLITIGGADRIHLESNRIQALPPELEKPEDLPLEVFGQVNERIASLFEILNRREFEDVALPVARELSGLSTDERRELAMALRRRVRSMIGEHDLRAEERDSYEKFARALEAERRERFLQERLLERLFGIRDAAAPLSPQTAIVIEDAEGDVTMENNEVSGVISLYGPPGSTQPTGDHLEKLGPLLRQGEVTFSESSGTLRMLNNTVTRLRIAEEATKHIIEISEGGGTGQIPGVYSRSFLTNNVIVSGGNLLLGYHLAISSNAFNSLDELRVPMLAGVVVGDAVSYVGNYATNSDIPLDNVSRVSEKAANLELIIIDHQ